MTTVWIVCVVGSAASGFMVWVLLELSREQRKSRFGERVLLQILSVHLQPGSVAARVHQIAPERKVKGTKLAA